MNVYIAAHNQTDARVLSETLRREGHSIISDWVFAQNLTFAPPAHPVEERIQIAFNDVRQVQKCDVLVLLEPDPVVRVPGGKFVEVGVALGLNKRVFVLGSRANMLMWHPLVTACETTWDLISELRSGV